MTMNTTGSDGLDGEADELVLKDEISGSDEDRSDSSSVQILDDEMDAEEGRRKKVPKVAPAASLEESSGELQPFDSFVVDTEAVEEEAENSAYQPEQRGGSGTNAQFSFAQVISHFTPVPKEPKRSDGQNRSAGKTCFNCGKVGHELSKCPEPRDARRISQNRNSFGSRRRESAGVAPRFHEQRQGPQPGVVSEALRDALDIGPHELPPWIYRMRKLGLLNGYPPAYRNRATERLTVKFHLDEEVTTTDGHRRKRKHAEATGEDEQCKIQPEKLIRYPGFNYSDDNCLDKDSHHWVIPPWDTFVQAQQHHIDTRRHQQTQDGGNDNDEEGKEDGVVANKRSKVSVTLDETEEISVLDEEEGKEEEAEEGELTDEEEEEEDENDADVLFVDARSRTTKKKKKGKSGGANVSLEEGEIVDESEEEQQQQMDMDLRTHSDRNNGKTKATDTAENDDKVTKRREKRSIGKRTTKKLGKKRRKDEAVTAPPVTGVVLPSSTTAAADVPPPPCPSATANGQGPSTTTANAKSTTTTANNSNEHQEKEEATAMLLKMQLGTPVPMSHNVCADKPDYAVEKPALEKWSIGIQAFQHQPPASSTGFFKRMHKIVKSVRKNGPAGVEDGADNENNNKKDNEENGKKAKEHQKR